MVKNTRTAGDGGFESWIRKIPWRRAWQPTPVFLPGESHGQRSLVGCSPRGCKKSDTAEMTSMPACLWFSHGQWTPKHRRPSRIMEAHSRPLFVFFLLRIKSSNKFRETSPGRRRACCTSLGGRSCVISEQRCQCRI